MQILEQLSDRKFVVELDDYDFDRTREMHVAHDYVRFCSNEGLQAKSGVELHTVNTCANWIPMRQEVTIPIREVISVVLPHLCRHEYWQPEHINPDKYKYDTGRIRYRSKEGTEMIAIRPRNQNDYIHIPYSVYKQIKEEDL